MNLDLSLDLADLEFTEVGTWPGVVKALCLAGAAVAVLAAGYPLAVADRRTELAKAEMREADLRSHFADRREAAAGLAAHRASLVEANGALAEMLARLPADTEVPGLVEDITRAAADNDLAIGRIDLAEERQAGFYRELPIVVEVVGDYHDIGSFAGDIARLSRLVTLHDFELVPRSGPRNLGLTIEVRTYRHAPATRHSTSHGEAGLDRERERSSR